MLDLAKIVKNQVNCQRGRGLKLAPLHSLAALTLLTVAGCRATPQVTQNINSELEPIFLENEELGFFIELDPRLVREEDNTLISADPCLLHLNIGFQSSSLCESVSIVVHRKSSHDTSANITEGTTKLNILNPSEILLIEIYPTPNSQGSGRPITMDQSIVNSWVQEVKALYKPQAPDLTNFSFDSFLDRSLD